VHAQPENCETQTERMILVAIPFVHVQQLLIAELFELGYLSHTVSNGQALVNAVELGQYQLIFLDLSLPCGTYKRYEQSLRDMRAIKSAYPFLPGGADFEIKRLSRKLKELATSSLDIAGEGELIAEIRRIERRGRKPCAPVVGVGSEANKLDNVALRKSGVDDFFVRETILKGSAKDVLLSLTQRWIVRTDELEGPLPIA
jgi:CheY-like chemotaxis protein